MLGKKVLLVGGSGFVGRNLKEHLEDREGFSVDAPSHAELDALDEDQVKRVLGARRYDVVLNCVDLPNLTPNYLEDRLRMFANLANASDLYDKMIYFGTGAEYGRHIPLTRVSEDEVGRAVPRDTYGLCMFEENRTAELSSNIYNLRLFGIFGKYEHWQTRFISNAICKALVGYPITIRQDRVMDYLYVDDLCLITEWAISSELERHSYNATSGRVYTLVELAHMVRDRCGAGVPIYVAKSGQGLEYTSNNDRLRRESGFDAEPMETSIDKLIEYYAAHLDMIDRESLLYQ